MKDKDLPKLLLKNGWELSGINSSHHILKKGNQREVIPVQGKEIKAGLLNAILKRTGLE